MVNFVKCPGCHQPEDCQAARECQTQAHWLDYRRQRAAAEKATPTPAGASPPVSHPANPSAVTPARPKAPQATPGGSIAESVAHYRTDAAYRTATGEEIATKVIRQVALDHPTVDRAAFVAEMVALGYNLYTVATQWGRARKMG